MSQSSREPFSPDFRYETVVSTLRGLANSELVYDYRFKDSRKWSKNMQSKMADAMNIIHEGAQIFANPKKSQRTRDRVEPILFREILYLKSIGMLRPALDRDMVLNAVARVGLKQDALSALLKDILAIQTEILEKIEHDKP